VEAEQGEQMMMTMMIMMIMIMIMMAGVIWREGVRWVRLACLLLLLLVVVKHRYEKKRRKMRAWRRMRNGFLIFQRLYQS
jgi:bacteriorhodopsin